MPFPLPPLSRDELARKISGFSPELLDDRALDALHAHYQELSVWNRRLSLIGPGTLNEVLERHYGESLAALPLIPEDARSGLRIGLDIGSALDLNNMPQTRTCTPQYAAPEMLDRIFDNYVMAPMQKIVFNRFCPDEARNAYDVAEARRTIDTACGWLEPRLEGRQWAAGADFSLADCAAGPSLHYADRVQPMAGRFPGLRDYLDRLEARPSFARVLREAEPYAHMFPAN